MDRRIFITKMQDVIQKRNLFLLLTLVLLMVVILQSVIVLKTMGNQRILLIPMPLKQTGWVDKTRVSDNYLTEMTRYYATLFLDRTPDDDTRQMAEILHYTAAQNYGELKAELVMQNDRLKKNHLSTWFSPVSVNVDTDALVADITGDLHIMVGKTEVTTKRTTYRAYYAYHNGALLIRQFNEVDKREESSHE